jgi:predicted PurR-regulated permease PerM
MDIKIDRQLRRSLPLFIALAGVLLILAAATILRLGRDVFVPVALAVLLSFVLAPGVRQLQRLAVPQGIAVLTTVVLAFALIAGLMVVAGNQLAGLGAELPRYQTTVREKIGRLGGAGASSGTINRAFEAFEETGNELRNLGGSAVTDANSSNDPARKPMTVIVQDGNGLFGTLGLVISPLLHPLTTAALVLLLVVFVLASREDLRNRLVRLVGTDDIQRTTVVIDDAAARLSRLFLAQMLLNTGFGIVVAAGLWLIGIPSPVLWGIFAGIMRFIPYVGGIAGVIPPLLLGLAVDPTWSMFLWTLTLFLIIQPLSGQVIEPLLIGRRTGLAPIAIVLSATIWTFLWGPIGLILSTPLTVCLVVLGRHIGNLEFLDIMLGDRPALSPPQLFYQRMLAGDPIEAVIKAKEFLRERALATYYDEVALEGLRLAHQDIARGRILPERQKRLLHTTERLIAQLETVRDPRPKGGQVSAEAEAAVIAAGPDQAAATQVLSRIDLVADWQGDMPVVCFAKPNTLDEVIGKMLAQVLKKHGINTLTVSSAQQLDMVQGSAKGSVRMIFLSFVDPLSTLHLRHAVRLARRQFPGAAVALGIWRERDVVMGRQLSRAARCDVLAPTIGVALSAVIHAARSPSTLQNAAVPIRNIA